MKAKKTKVEAAEKFKALVGKVHKESIEYPKLKKLSMKGKVK